jgi:aspartate aminotransferase-like enzyme
MAASGRPFLQIPGPTNVPARIRAGHRSPTSEHRGRAFAALAKAAIAAMRPMFGTKGRTSPRGPSPSPRAYLAGNAGAEPARQVAQ